MNQSWKPSSQNVDSMRNFNRASIMRLVLDNEDIDRTRLAELSGLTNAAITRIVQELIGLELLSESGSVNETGGRGRRRTGLRIKRDGAYVLGISILAYNTSVAICDLGGAMIATQNIEADNIEDPASTLDQIAEAAGSLIARTGVPIHRILASGAAVAGNLDENAEIWRQSPYLGWPRFNIRKSLHSRLGIPLVVENVNRAIAIAEARIGCCTGMRDLVLLRVALGIGGALVANGKIVHGLDNRAGDFGHMLANPQGLRCGCGKTGCLTTLASGDSILHKLGLLDDTRQDTPVSAKRSNQLREILQLSEQGSTRETAAILEAGSALGKHMAPLLSALDPQVVVLTGPLGRNREYSNAFKAALEYSGAGVAVYSGSDHAISDPAVAAAGLALSELVYSPELDTSHLSSYILAENSDATQEESVL